MLVFKNRFKYNINSKNNGLEISYQAIDKDILIAAYIYLYDKGYSRVIAHKTSYHKNLDKYHIPLVSGHYQIKFFMKIKNSSKYFDSLLTDPIDLKVLENYTPEFFKKEFTDEIITKLSKTGLNSNDFSIVMSAKHNSHSSLTNFFALLSSTSLRIIRKEKCTYDTSKFLLNCIFYVGSRDFLLCHREQLFFELMYNNSKQERKDILFWFGLMQYKIGNNIASSKIFRELLIFKNDLSFHQTGAISYLHDIAMLSNVKVKECELDLIVNKNTHNNGCILISCDYGYYLVYIKNRLKDISNYCLLHLHFILSDSLEKNKTYEDLKCFSNVNFSYELRKSEFGNIKTYYSISRYLILDKIIEKYNLPVIVADADLDFNSLDFKIIFAQIGDEDIFLRKTASDLPWLRIMAGFNVFGKNTFNSIFIAYLKKYLTYCFYSGRDGWMLDQVALSQCVNIYNDINLIKDINILNLEDSVVINIRQVSNRKEKREMIGIAK